MEVETEKFKLQSENHENEMYTYIAIPIDSLQIAHEQFEATNVVDNVMLKAMPDGNFCIIGTGNGLNTFEFKQADNTTDTNLSDKEIPAENNKSVESSNLSNNIQIEINQVENEATLPKKAEQKMEFAQCKICDEVMKISKYKKHMEEHRNKKTYVCQHCDEGFNVEENFKLHMALHSKRDPQCPACGRKFQRYASLKAHLVTHQLEESYYCQECLMEFEKEDDYKEHLESHKKDIIKLKSAEKTEYICPHCKYTFTNSTEYKEHIAVHMKINKMIYSRKSKKKTMKVYKMDHKCNVCQKMFSKQALLERHMRIHSGEKPFVCPHCSRGFNQKNSLMIHMTRHTGIKPYKCTLCSAKFSQKGNLRAHVEKTHTAPIPGEKLFKCSQCTCVFRKVASLNGHITKVHSASRDGQPIDKSCSTPNAAGTSVPVPEANEINQSNVIQVPSTSAKNDVIHITDSTIEGAVRTYEIKQRKCGDVRYNMCHLCTKEFKKPSDLIRHIRTHTQEKPFQCHLCSSSFALKSTLEAHVGTHLGSKDYKCSICPKTFPSLKTLNTHYKKHDKNLSAVHTKPFKCSECDKYFTSIEKANVHMAVHEIGDVDVLKVAQQQKEKNQSESAIVLKQPLVETTNGYQYIPPPKPRCPYGDLEQYKNRPFKCHICNAAFTKPVHIKRHMLTHTGEKQFSCNLCSKAFYTSYGLQDHLKFHNGIRNYCCKICNKRFVTNTILKRHMLLHNPDKPFVCPYCNKRFKTVTLCRRHINVHKKDINIQAANEGVDNGEISVNLDISFIDNENNSVPVISGNAETIQNYIPEISVADAAKSTQFVKRKIITENGEINEAEKSTVFISNNEIPRGDPPPYDKIANTVPSIDPNQFINIEQTDNIQEGEGACQTIYINYDDLPTGLNVSGLYNTLLPLKLPASDPLLLNDLQDSSNILFPLDTNIPLNDTQNIESFNSNLPYSAHVTGNDLNSVGFPITALTEKESDVEQLIPNLGITFKTKDHQVEETVNLFEQQKLVTSEVQNSEKFSSAFQKSQNNDVYDEQIIKCDKCKCLVIDHSTHHCENDQPIQFTLNENVYVLDTNNTDNLTSNTQQKELTTKETTKESSSSKNAKKKDNVKKVTSGYQCNECDESFNTKASVAKHRRKHLQKNQICDNVCTFCSKKFKKPSDLQRHVRTHTGEKPFACDKCNKSFSLKSTLLSHLRTHIPGGNKEFNCHICNSYFSTKNSLRVHLIVHTGQKPYQCPLCPLKFRTSANKNAHIKAHERDTLRKHPPKKKANILEKLMPTIEPMEVDQNILDEEFFKTGDVANQVEIQDSVVNPVIENIQLVPFLYQQLQSNMILQDGTVAEYPISFGIDGDTINQVINIPTLQESAENPLSIIDAGVLIEPDKLDSTMQKLFNDNEPGEFPCETCGKKYKCFSSLRKHKKIHLSDFKCDKCVKGFTTKENYDNHMKLHEGDRPYKCNLCANSFSGEGHLKTHLKRLHNM